MRLIDNSDKDVVGAIPPKNGYNWAQLANKLDRHPEERDPDKLQQFAMSYAVNYSDNRAIKKGLLEVKHLSMDMTLIRRNVFETMIEKYPELKYEDDIGILTPGESAFLYGFFNDLLWTNAKTGKKHHLSQDYSFCQRYRNIQGKIHADVTIPVSVYAPTRYRGNFLHSVTFQSI